MDNIAIQDILALEREAEQLVKLTSDMHAAPMFDPELGVGSGEAMQIELEYIHNISKRYQRPYAIILIDMDSYSGYESQYGTRAAKLAHKLMAEHVRHCCRTVDRIYRCGAETALLLILPETDFAGSSILAGRIVSAFAGRNIPFTESEPKVLTLSASPAAVKLDQGVPVSNWSDLLDDALLYVKVAQGQGGNRVCHRDLIEEAAS